MLAVEPGKASATGVAIEITENDKPVELNKKQLIKVSQGGDEDLKLQASYYQTQSSVQGGKVSATATINFEYP